MEVCDFRMCLSRLDSLPVQTTTFFVARGRGGGVAYWQAVTPTWEGCVWGEPLIGREWITLGGRHRSKMLLS